MRRVNGKKPFLLEQDFQLFSAFLPIPNHHG